MPNPVLVEVTRGGIVESRHTGAFAVVDAQGAVLRQAGDIEAPVFPRSAVKAFQCLAMIESGAADRFGFSEAEIALACASHNGEPVHVATARAMLAKAGVEETDLECGTHWPHETEALHELVRAGHKPGPVHNNCSGKHAGMLAVARVLGVPKGGYTRREHPVQRRVAEVLSALCDVPMESLPCGIDGCSVPTWAIPPRNLALGFARFGSGSGLPGTRREAAERIVAAVRAHPFMVAGTGRFCTRLMADVPRLFVKTGAEGVFCASVPHAGLGIALKCDDGAHRASEAAIAAILGSLEAWTPAERAAIASFARVPLTNWRKIEVGEVRAVLC
jgi:L-asparaginase II